MPLGRETGRGWPIPSTSLRPGSSRSLREASTNPYATRRTTACESDQLQVMLGLSLASSRHPPHTLQLQPQLEFGGPMRPSHGSPY
jgi:hypothetical protein